ncbi:MAG: phage holin family protein [Polyangiaceae bacterium]
MAEAATADSPAASSETGMLVRAYRAFELLFSVHARLAQKEASEDARRIVTGIILAVLAFSLLSFALILGHAAAVMAVEHRFHLGYPASIGAVAGADIALALLLLLLARARLSAPVLPETRAMVKKAAAVLKG